MSAADQNTKFDFHKFAKLYNDQKADIEEKQSARATDLFSRFLRLVEQVAEVKAETEKAESQVDQGIELNEMKAGIRLAMFKSLLPEDLAGSIQSVSFHVDRSVIESSPPQYKRSFSFTVRMQGEFGIRTIKLPYLYDENSDSPVIMSLSKASNILIHDKDLFEEFCSAHNLFSLRCFE